MANKCSDCGFQNEDGKLFCGNCGEPLGGDAKLIRDMEKLNKKKEEEAKNKDLEKDVPLEARSSDEDYAVKKREPKKDNTDAFLIGMALCAFFIICLCGFYVLANWDKFF